MWKYVCLCEGLFLSIFVTNIWGLNIGYPRTREQIYIDVLKNITHVNNILKDLLENYKQVKRDYEAKANLQNELSIESEFDGSDKEVSRVKYKRIKNDDKEDFHPVTQMILLDEGYQDGSSVESNAAEEETMKEIQPSSMENIGMDEVSANQKIDLREQMEPSIANINIDYTSANEKIGSRNVDNSKRDTLLIKNPIQTKNQPSINQSNKPEMIIIGTAVKYNEEPLTNLGNRNKEKREALFDEGSNIGEEYLPKNNFIDRNVKPVLRIGFDYDENIRHDKHIDSNDNANMYDTSNKWKTIRDHLLKISIKKDSRPIPKVTLVLIRSNNKEQKSYVIKKNIGTDSVSGVEEMIRDRLKTKILRDAYGDACLKVALRKCYKTLLEVRRNVCGMDFKCKDSFKEDFKGHSKKACIKEFNYHGNDENKKNDTSDETYYKRGDKGRFESSDAIFQDIGRSSLNINYFNLCLPVMMSETKTDTKAPAITKKKIRKELSQDMNKTEPINILRDRYEMECRRMSREKCERACQYAVSMTCDQHVCMRREKREFSRTCRSECKNAFLPYGDSDSYSDSDSSSDGDSDSDSDSISSW